MNSVFQIGEEEFSFGDEEFWSDALALEAATTEPSDSVDTQASNARTSGSLTTQSPVQQMQTGSPTAQNNLKQGRSGDTLVGSRTATTLRDSGNNIPTTPGNQPKRKFSFKPKSPRGGLSIQATAVDPGMVCINKRAKLDDKIIIPLKKSNLQVESERLSVLQDKNKNIQPGASNRNLRPPTNHVLATPNFRQPVVNLNGKEETQARTATTNNAVQQTSEGITCQGNKTQESQLRNGIGLIQTPTKIQPNQVLRMPGKWSDTVTKGVPEILSHDINDSFDEQLNSWEDDFDWDPVIPSSTSGTKTVSQVGSNMRSINRAISEESTSNNVNLICNISKPDSLPKSPAVHSHTTSNLPRLSVEQDEASRFMGLQNSLASSAPSNGQTNNANNPTHRFSLPHSGQGPNSHKKTLPQTMGLQFQGNQARMNNFQPRTPSPSYPIRKPSSTPFQPRNNTPLRVGTPGYTSPAPSTHSPGTPLGALSTPNIRNPNSTPHQYSTPVQRFNNSANQSRYGANQSVRPFSTHGGAKLQSRGMSTPQTPVLTSRVAQMFQTPTSVNAGPSRTRVRKFPGPAGVLPKLAQGQKLSDLQVLSPENDQDTPSTSSAKPEEFLSSQDVGDTDFSHGAWQTMKVDLDLGEDNPHSILSQNNIALLLRKASLKRLTKNKVPHLCVLIKAIIFNTDASVVLRDPTGEIQGTLHRHLVEEHQADLKPGSVLVLRQVGVLSPTLRNHYLNITPSNLIQVYPSESTISQSSQGTPKSQTSTSLRRPTKELSSPEEEQTSSSKSESSEAIHWIDPGKKQIHDPQGGERTNEETPQRRKRSQSSELRQQRDSSGRRWDTPRREAADAVDGSCRNSSKATSMEIKSQQFLSGPREDMSSKVLDERLELKRQRRGSTEMNHSGDNVKLLRPHQESATKNISASRTEHLSSMNHRHHNVKTMGLNSTEHSSDYDVGPKGDDYTELLADIGDDFFDDF